MRPVARALVYVPIYHNPWLENGRQYSRKTSALPADVPEYLRELGKYWDEIDSFAKSLPINKVYQDSFDAIPDDEWHAVFEKGEALGIRNFASVNRILSRGARLMKTESKVEMRRFLSAVNGDLVHNRKALLPRDRFIARTIDRTLSNGEIGLIFMGIGHKVDSIIRREHKDIAIGTFTPSNSQLMYDAFERLAKIGYEKKVA